jgi:hypothetical protein
MGQKWYQSTAYGFLLLRWTFFKSKGPPLFKKRKRVFSIKMHFVVL